MNKPLTANEVESDITVLRNANAREKQRNRSGQRGGASKMRFEGPFAGRTIAMLESPAYRVLTLSAHRILARLEIELHRHGGKPEENGQRRDMPNSFNPLGSLPETGYVRQSQPIPAIFPFSSATLWRKVKAGTFPKPIKLGPRITAWRVEDIRSLVERLGR